MEGPSLVIACEEIAPFLKKRVQTVNGTAKIPMNKIQGSSITRVCSWGKHLLLEMPKLALRIHFLMFGSYRINNPRENRVPKLQLDFGSQSIYFYSCAIRELPPEWEAEYDWSVDLMSKQWNSRRALRRVREHPKAQVADVLMDQSIFAGLGNIMKNEILFRLRLHPETKIGDLAPARQAALVRDAHRYAWQFYHWKKAGVLKRNWQIMRKRKCPHCQRPVKKRVTGKLKRWSHYCSHCQVKK